MCTRLVEKPESKDISGRPRCRQEYNTEMNVTEEDHERVNCILAQRWVQWRELPNRALDLLVT
jgi:hypothetical protein